MAGPDISIRHGFTPRILFGGSKSEQFSLDSLSRAKTSEKPRVHSQHKYKGDQVLTRTGHRGATVLARLHKAFEPKIPKNGKGNGGDGSGSVGKDAPKTGTTAPRTTTTVQQSGVPQTAPTTSSKPPDKPLPPLPLEARAKAMKLEMEELRGKQPDPMATPKERAKAEIEMLGAQMKLKSDAEKALGEVGKELTKKIGELKGAKANGKTDVDPEVVKLQQDIATLKSQRRTFIEIGIGAEFPNVGTSVEAPLGKSGVVGSLSLLFTTCPRDQISDLEDLLGIKNQYGIKGMGGTPELARMIDDFNAGRPVKLDDGTPVSPDVFKKKVDDLAAKILNDFDSDAARKAASELKHLSAQLGLKIDLGGAVTQIEAMLDKWSSLYKEPTPPPSPHPYPNGFPLSGMLTAIGSAFRGGGEVGTGTKALQDQSDTCEGVRIIAKQLAAGEVSPLLHGYDTTFDKASLLYKQASAGDLAVQKLKDDRIAAGKPLPPDHLLALLAKPEQQLTVRERASMIEWLGKPMGSVSEAREALAKARDDIDNARKDGVTTAVMRHELTLMDKKLSRLLTIDKSLGSKIKGAWYRPNGWGAGEKVTNTLAGIKIDAQFMKGLHNLGGKSAGREVAILVAQFATLQAKTLENEQQVLGLHKPRGDGSIQSVMDQIAQSPDLQPGYAKVDPQNPLAHFGITNKDLQEIGLDPTDIQEVGKYVETLTRQGMGSIEDVQQVMTSMKDVSKIVLKSELIQETIHGYEQNLARMQGAHLLSDTLTDAGMSYRLEGHVIGVDKPTQMVRKDDPEVVGYFQKRNEALEKAIGPKGFDQMKNESEAYRKIELEIAMVYDQHLNIQTEIENRRKVITEAQKPPLSIKTDPHDPRGLESAKQIIVALNSDKEARETSDPVKKGEAIARREKALSNLRGFDPEQMKRPLFSRAFGDKPEIGDLAKLREVAEAIVYVREGGPLGMELLERDLERLAPSLEQIVMLRRQAAPEQMAHVKSMIRAAVLTEWQNSARDLNISGGGVTEGFDPTSKATREAIEKTLTSWGLKVDHFGPEIDEVLFSRMTADDIALWRAETTFSDAMIERMKDDRPTLSMERIIGRRVMDPQTRQSMLGMLEGFQEGDKLDLKAGQRITLDTGKIPVEPTGLVGIRARLAGAHIGQFEVELGSDGYKVHFRTGGEVKGNLDGVVGKKFGDKDGLGPNLEARLEASLGLEGSGSHLTGMTISFDKGPAGREALVNLVAKMIDGDKITVKDWQSATDVGFTYEDRAKGGVSIKGEARLLAGGKIKDSSLGDNTGTKLDDEFIGVGVSAGISSGVSLGGKWVGVDSLNQVTRRGEVAVETTFSMNAGIYARFYNLMNMGTGHAVGQDGQKGVDSHLGTNSEGKPLYNITENVGNYDLLNIGVSLTTTSVRKWKQVMTPEGLFQKCEKVRQSNVQSGPIAAFASCLDTPGMKAMLIDDPKDPHYNPKYKDVPENIRQFMKLVGPRDHIAVTYAPKPGVQEEANRLMALAIAARNDGDIEQAMRYETAARAIMDKDSNYYPAKIGLITTDIEKRETTNLNARWIKWDTFSDGKSEHQGLVLSFPPP